MLHKVNMSLLLIVAHDDGVGRRAKSSGSRRHHGERITSFFSELSREYICKLATPILIINSLLYPDDHIYLEPTMNEWSKGGVMAFEVSFFQIELVNARVCIEKQLL